MQRFGSDGCEKEKNVWRRVFARVGLRAALSFLSGLAAAAGILLIFWARHGGLSPWRLAAVLGTLLLLTEITARHFLQERYPNPFAGERAEFRMSPHIFAHLLPSRRYSDISEKGFRITRTSPDRAGKPLLYLAGDCTLFENHLLPEETFAYRLSELLPEVEVANAGVPHYTALHAYNRLVTDLVSGIRPESVLLHLAPNDVLGFIHHKNGTIRFDHSHWYKPWLPYEEIYRKVAPWPTAALRLFLFSILCDHKRLSWIDLLEDFSQGYERPENVRQARELFDPSGFVTCLELFRAATQATGARLVLTTFYYNKTDMSSGEPRWTYAWGMDRLNDEIRKFSLLHNLPLIDLARDLEAKGAEVRNKWHYTASGNRVRAEAVACYWRSAFASRAENYEAVPQP